MINLNSKDINTIKENERQGFFEVKDLPPGFGATLGNPMRRILLSSLEGFAICAVKIDGITHEFSSIEGIVEDVTEIISNIKQIRFKKKINQNEDFEICNASIEGEKIVKAGDLGPFIHSFQILNQDLVLCKKSTPTPFTLSFIIDKGKGYVQGKRTIESKYLKEKNIDKEEREAMQRDYISIDAIYSPIKKVNYKIENSRVEDRTDYEKLTLDLETDGSISPNEALKKASKILIENFMKFNLEEKTSFCLNQNTEDNKRKEEPADKKIELLNLSIEDKLFDFSQRTINCLKSANILIIEDLIKTTESDLLKIRNFGQKSENEIKKNLQKQGLSLKKNEKK